MRKPGLLLAFATAAALSVAGPKPTATLLASLKDHRPRGWALSADRRRVYYLEDSTQAYVRDRSTRRSSRVLGKTTGLRAIPAVSALGDRLAFLRNAEGIH